MKTSKFSVFLLSLIGSIALAFEAHASCAFVNQDYSSRDNNRYNEGIVSNSKINSDFKLVSFAISDKVKNSEDRLDIKIPKSAMEKPYILVREFEKEYRLDNITLSSENKKFYSFKWSSCVIQKAKIDINKLRFRAVLLRSQDILLPVIFGEGGKAYSFVFRTQKPTVIKTFQVKQEEEIVYRTSNPSKTGEILLNWDGRDETQNIVKPGIYNLFFEVEIREINGLIESYTEQVQFYHNPNWLKN